jgi:hypothetical protein
MIEFLKGIVRETFETAFWEVIHAVTLDCVGL